MVSPETPLTNVVFYFTTLSKMLRVYQNFEGKFSSMYRAQATEARKWAGDIERSPCVIYNPTNFDNFVSPSDSLQPKPC